MANETYFSVMRGEVRRQCGECSGTGRQRTRIDYSSLYGSPGWILCRACLGEGALTVFCRHCGDAATTFCAGQPACGQCKANVTGELRRWDAELAATVELPVIGTDEAAANLLRGVRT